MRVTAVDMYSANYEEAITFTLDKTTSKDQYMVRTILGLDADDIAPKFYAWGLNGKSRFYDFGLKPREIVMRIVLNPRFRLGESYSEVRDELYRTISANRTGLVTLHFKSGATTVASIFGSMVKFEAVHFTNLPEVQLTIRCNDPMFKAINPVIFEPAELSTVNPILIPDSLSTSPHGFNMRLTFKADLSSFTIQDVATSPEWKFKIMPAGGFLIGDVLYFSSETSNKYLYVVRGANTIQLMNSIEPTSVWPVIFPGQNAFHFVNIAAFNWNRLEYYASYWGV